MSTSLYQKSTDPQLTGVNLFYKKEFYQKASNFLDAMGSYSDQLEKNIEYQKALVSNDPITAQADFFAKINGEFDSMQPQFAANWISLFNRSLDEVKNQVKLKTGGLDVFQQFGDSVGSLSKIENYFDDATQLVSDITGKNTITPLRFGSSSSNKISPTDTLLLGDISKKVNTVFRRNMQNIQDTISSATKAHGSNLIPDTEHFKRMKGIFVGFTQKIQSEFKSLFGVIDAYCKYNPRGGATNMQLVPNFNVTVDVEGSPINQDLLGRQLAETTSKLTTQKVLG